MRCSTKPPNGSQKALAKILDLNKFGVGAKLCPKHKACQKRQAFFVSGLGNPGMEALQKQQ
jgi:hypothetical protein